MKYETLNTGIAALALMLACFSTWKQFERSPDDLLLQTGALPIMQNDVNVDEFSFPFGSSPGLVLTGPVFWPIDFINPRDRSIVVTNIEVFKLDENMRRSHYTGLVQAILKDPNASAAVEYPINLPAHEGLRLFVGLKVPIAKDTRDQGNCAQSGFSLMAMQRCFFASGRDLFGNSFTAQFIKDGEWIKFDGAASPDDPILDNSFSGQFDDEIITAPEFLVLVKTADGSQFSTILGFYPSIH